ncbi:CRISPR-associated HD domain protein [Tepidanaerobacter acetatoxydans Re1]|uniref:CRISPR-associated HD domain protein n=1 Tax=Tepidanaerobacter acetatoxydans (strain DSM 21804 / JCM 16047 / Re1) TaxID=1209989 RepID=F4LS58_TEPAE|nr:CRISPR-associated helicase/endonuclease Cas3 [Tepidanaerobacter acetatoxydans]AEE90321.1 CRISPR-associated HD domain protein [Tepidanaerobacter acetatoxydans Re1]CDI40289.1 CRISPR-associated HD domain protein [Tepidanaerobacter acetatoxydans Re1]
MQYLAHYDKGKQEKQFLNEHLTSVATLAKTRVLPCVVFDDLDSSKIEEICYWTGYFHDLGKYSIYFQDYLQKGISSPLKNHAHISACFAYSYLSNKATSRFDSDKTLLFFIYTCIRLHHTSLKCKGLFNYGIWEDLIPISKNISDKSNEIIKDLGLAQDMSDEEFRALIDIEKFKANAFSLERIPLMFNNSRISNPKWYFLLIYLFSMLIDTDKLDSANIKSEKISTVPPENVTSYIFSKHGKKSDTELINNREKARKSMIEVVESLSNDALKNVRFFTITAPTGIGKTLSSLQCALDLQQKIAETEGYTPRIITAIPFINIIEQNKLEYENVMGKECKIAVHHRLSDFGVAKSKDETIPVDRVLLETESWEADVILTTFVQLFQSLFSSTNKMLKKINKLAGSIVILDEIQAIPEKYMPLIGASLQMIAKYYGTRFILMTATQPKILQFGSMLLQYTEKNSKQIESIELLPNHEEYFKCLTRTKFVPLLENVLDTEDFLDVFFNKWDYTKSCLIVVNTIKRSIDVYKKIKEELALRGFKLPVYYLSTNIIPLKRRDVIQEVKDLLESEQPVILVSTQTIEAGVDLDFDMAFRDFAPLDSLVQTAGRVNRQGKKGNYSPVYIIQLENDSHYIYDLSLREVTINLLKELLTAQEEIKETDYVSLTKRYYDLILKEGVDDASKRIWNDGILKLDFDKLEEFKLIESPGEVYDVFIEKELSATNLADAYEQVLGYKDSFDYDLSKIFPDFKSDQFEKTLNVFQRKALLRLIMAKMHDYIIQVRVSRLKENRPVEFKERGNIESSLYWVPPTKCDDYYDEDTGFKDESGDGFI